MLKTIWVYGIGIIDEVFLGFARTRLLPIGICMFEAYFYKISIEPKEASILWDSGFKAFPLYPLIVLELIPFLTVPV